MKITKSLLNTQEIEIINIIEKAGDTGINVRGMVKSGLSPKTLMKYLPVLENAKKLVHHTSVKNSKVYRIRYGSELTYEESHMMIHQSIDELEEIMLSSIEHAQKWNISEQLEVYQHIVNVITLSKYFKQYTSDISDSSQIIPKETQEYLKKMDGISKIISKKINMSFSSLVLIHLQNTMTESLTYLEQVTKRRRGRKIGKKHRR